MNWKWSREYLKKHCFPSQSDYLESASIIFNYHSSEKRESYGGKYEQRKELWGRCELHFILEDNEHCF
jgi:hypothetical protein